MVKTLPTISALRVSESSFISRNFVTFFSSRRCTGSVGYNAYKYKSMIVLPQMPFSDWPLTVYSVIIVSSVAVCVC